MNNIALHIGADLGSRARNCAGGFRAEEHQLARNDKINSLLKQVTRLLFVGWITLLPWQPSAFGQPGSLDGSFASSGSGADGAVYAMVLQSDGRVVIGGAFSTVGGLARSGVARLATNGLVDSAFGNGLSGADASVLSAALQANGKVVVGGLFANFNGQPRRCVARLQGDGSLDSSFLNGLSGLRDDVSDNPKVQAIAVQSDGRILIGGWFTVVNDSPRMCLARLLTNGVVDASFLNGMSGANGEVHTIKLQTNGKILIGGLFQTVNGTARNYLARLNTDGSLDASFVPETSIEYGVMSQVDCLELQSDGKILLGGACFDYGTWTTRGIVLRLGTNGILDARFLPNLLQADSTILCLALESGGKIVAGGDFTSASGWSRGHVARINPDGALDLGFSQDLEGADASVFCLAIQPDGKVIAGGAFTSLNGLARNSIARLETLPVFDASSVDFADTPFAHAAPGTNRIYDGFGRHAGSHFVETFSNETLLGVTCLKRVSSAPSITVIPQKHEDTFWIAKDTAGIVWVFKYIRDGETKILANSKAQLLALGNCTLEAALMDGSYWQAPPLNNGDYTQTFTSFEAYPGDYPFSLIEVTESENESGEYDLLYYHESVGLVRKEVLAGQGSGKGWKLRGFGIAPPTFDASSADFSAVPFLHAAAGTNRIYEGLGDFAGRSYLDQFTTEPLLGVACLKWRSGAPSAAVTVAKHDDTFWMARDTAGKIWLFRWNRDGTNQFQANATGEIVPLEEVTLEARLMQGNYNYETSLAGLF